MLSNQHDGMVGLQAYSPITVLIHEPEITSHGSPRWYFCVENVKNTLDQSVYDIARDEHPPAKDPRNSHPAYKHT